MTATAHDTTVPVLSLQHVQAGYNRRTIIRDINLEVAPGEWIALLGPNGSGKTTLLYCTAGLLAPTAGEVSICGYSLERSPVQAKAALGFGCAPDRLPGLLTGRQCLEIYAAAKRLSAIDSDVMSLARSLRFLPKLDHYVDTYSTGTRQKLAILLALLGDPKLIVLDEAFNGLDPASALTLKIHLRELAASRRAGILLATHDLDLVERHANRAALLLDGRLLHQWSSDEIAALRVSDQGFEAAVAAAASVPATM
jgi:ABC-2 type transport system ATP-binding protein